MPLTGRTIALAEGRQLEDLSSLLKQEGATIFPCPLLAILDPPDDKPALAWMQALIAGRFDWVLLFTGEGVRRLLGCADRHGLRDAFRTGLAATSLLTRGPKPVKALREVDLKPMRVAATPTTEGVITALADVPLEGKTIGVQMYREDNPPLLAYLRERGAVVETVLPYVYAPASDSDRVVQLIDRLAQGDIAALVFTSSPQVDRLFEVALDRGLSERLDEGLRKTKVAAIGPIVADHLRQRQAPVDICPEQGWVMKNLVQQIKRAFDAPP